MSNNVCVIFYTEHLQNENSLVANPLNTSGLAEGPRAGMSGDLKLTSDHSSLDHSFVTMGKRRAALTKRGRMQRAARSKIYV